MLSVPFYQWLERSRSSDTDNDGVACESTPNAGGYVPNVQPVEPQGCPADAETWRGLQICEEQPREGYDRDAFGSAYSSLEDDIIDMLPSTMKAGGQVYTPYSCLAFEIRADGTAATDIEHIVALAEAHDSRIADDRRRDIAADLDNLTIADSRVNRTEKSDRDAGEWTPARHGAWFAAQVIAVKLEYGLSVDPAERAALESLLVGGGAQLSCVDADTTSPAVAISSDASAPVTGPFSIAIAFSEPVTGFELEDLVVGNGSASELQGNNATYTVTITPEASGTVTVDIATGGAGGHDFRAGWRDDGRDALSVPSPPPAGRRGSREPEPDAAAAASPGSTSRPTTAPASPVEPHRLPAERSPATAGGAGTDVRGDRAWPLAQVALERHRAAPSCGRGRRAMAAAPSAPQAQRNELRGWRHFFPLTVYATGGYAEKRTHRPLIQLKTCAIIPVWAGLFLLYGTCVTETG